MNSLSDVIALRRKSAATRVGAGMTASITATSIITPHIASTTTGFQYQARTRIAQLDLLKEQYRNEVISRLADNPNYTGSRSKGVSLAWEYERTDIEWGGRGSENWTRTERQEILRRGTLGGAEGHHQKNVSAHPEEQANPDNIKIYRTKDEHLQKGHGGDFHNDTDAPMKDKTQMLKDTNNERVLKNELFGAGLAAVIAFATTTSITFIIDCAQNGWEPENRKKALRGAVKVGMEGTAVTMVSYAISRILMEPVRNWAIDVIAKVFKHNVGEAGRTTIGSGIAAAVVIIVTAIYIYRKLRKSGVSRKEALQIVAKRTALSVLITGIILSIQYSYGNVWAIVAGLILTAGQVGYTIYLNAKEKELLERIQHLIIEKTYPAQYALSY